MKQIELDYTETVNIDLVEAILKKRFPDKEFKLKKRKHHKSFMQIFFTYDVMVIVVVAHDQKKRRTIITVKDGQTIRSFCFLGYIGLIRYYRHRKEHTISVFNAIKEELNGKMGFVILDEY